MCNARFVCELREYRVMGSKKRSSSNGGRRNGGVSISGKIFKFFFPGFFLAVLARFWRFACLFVEEQSLNLYLI